jgi:tRNA(Ile)-lysidine synthase
VVQQVSIMARRHRMFEPRTAVVVAVSGGADSLCLLHSLVRLRRLLAIEPVCFHFDHRLRSGSDADARYVLRQAGQLDVEFVLRQAQSEPAHGESVEAWARTERYRALFQVVEEREASAAAVGHTMDDQAETVLLAIVRGGGLDALAGMQPVSPPVVRPLLESTREDTVSFCRALGLRPRKDPMNQDPAYLRVAVRREVIPLLEQRLGRNVRATVARTASLLRADADLLDRMAIAEAETASEPAHPDGRSERILLRAAALASLPVPIAARIVRRTILSMGVLPEAEHIAAILDLASHRRGRSVDLPEGLRASREREYVRFSRPSPSGPPPLQASRQVPKQA